METKLYTENTVINPDTCKALDWAMYSDNPPPMSPARRQYVFDKFNFWHNELVNYIRTYNAELAENIKGRGLYYLYCYAQRVRQDHAEHECERRQANIQSARTQLKAWEK